MIAGLVVFAWWVVGVAGFVFWWTRDWDLKTPDAVAAVFFGFLGPIAWVIGWVIHGDHSRTRRTLISRRSP